ncbi:hypothetical protein KKI24_11325 [bacterium]|nr:hypothetical protein [bacterium]
MKKYGWMVFLLLVLLVAGPLYAADEKEVTTKEQLEMAIKEVGLEKAISMALASGALSGEEISGIVFSMPDANPMTVASALAESGVPAAAIASAAAEVGLNPAIIARGIQKGEEKRQEVAAKEKEAGSQDTAANKEQETENKETAGTEQAAGNERETGNTETATNQPAEPTTVAANQPTGTGLGFGEDVANRPQIPVTGPPGGVDPTANPVSPVRP